MGYTVTSWCARMMRVCSHMRVHTCVTVVYKSVHHFSSTYVVRFRTNTQSTDYFETLLLSNDYAQLERAHMYYHFLLSDNWSAKQKIITNTPVIDVFIQLAKQEKYLDSMFQPKNHTLLLSWTSPNTHNSDQFPNRKSVILVNVLSFLETVLCCVED